MIAVIQSMKIDMALCMIESEGARSVPTVLCTMAVTNQISRAPGPGPLYLESAANYNKASAKYATQSKIEQRAKYFTCYVACRTFLSRQRPLMTGTTLNTHIYNIAWRDGVVHTHRHCPQCS
jgi:hypothetical protein